MPSPLTPEVIAELRRLEQRYRGYMADVALVKIDDLDALISLAERVCPECWGHGEVVLNQPSDGPTRCPTCHGTGWKQTGWKS